MRKKDETPRGHRGHQAVPVGPRLERLLQVAYRARRPVLLEGPTGIGKSQIIRQVADSLGIRQVVLDLSLLEPPDLVGLPVIRGDCTTYASPEILPRDGEGVLLLEELNRAERYIQQPALQLLTARRLHGYVLPGGWSCCAAVNPEKGDYQVTPLDPALRARFLDISVRADRRAWLRWAKQNGIHRSVLRLATAHDGFLDDVPPRTWDYVSDVLQVLSPDESREKTLVRDILGGYLPAQWVELLLAKPDALAEDSELDPYKLLRTFHVDSELQKAIRELESMGLTDRLHRVSRRVREILNGPELGRLVSEKSFELCAFEKLLERLPGDDREDLQDTFGASPFSGDVIDMELADVLERYRGGVIEKKVRAWLVDPNLRHRVRALAGIVERHVKGMPGVQDFRNNRHAMINLGRFISQVGEEHSASLVRALAKRNIEPIFPKRA